MRVLDLDMDFFLSGPCPLATPGERPDEACAQAWSEEEVVWFLEEQCGLSAERPVPGAIFDTHDTLSGDMRAGGWKQRICSRLA